MQVGHGPARSAITRVQVKTDYPGGMPSALSLDETQNLAAVSLPETIVAMASTAARSAVACPDHQAYLVWRPLTRSPCAGVTCAWTCRASGWRCRQGGAIGVNCRRIVSRAGDDHRLEVTYCILDRVGNNSSWAPAASCIRRAHASPGPDQPPGPLAYQPSPRLAL